VEQIPAVTYIQEPIEAENPKAITYMSPQYEAMLGYPASAEMVDEQHWLRILHPEDRERVLAEEDRTDKTGEPYVVEYRLIARDGSVVWVHDEAQLVSDGEGKPLYWLGVQYDITEQKRTEEELRQSEERFRVLSDEVVEGLVLSENGRVIDANHSLTEMFGYELDELIGIDASLLTPPDYREVVRRRILEEDASVYESRGLKKDGTVFPIEIRPRHLPYSGRRIRVTSVIDLTERRRQEEALRQSEALYRTVVEQAAENIFLVDAETRRVLEANDALKRSLGYTEDELRGMTLYDIVAHDRESVDLNIGRVMEEGGASLGERQYRRKDGSLADVDVNVSAVPYNGERAMCIVAHDVTERNRAEAMLEEIREAERNRIARELHDGTLQDIVYALQELQVMQVVAGDEGDPALQDTAEALRRSVEGLRSAIFELRLEGTLDLSLDASLESLVDLNRRMARDRYDIELIVDDGFPTRLSEKTGQEITRLVQEALTNVRRHAEAAHVRVELGTGGTLAYVEVADDGRGFDPNKARTGMGRQSMSQRALELGGELDVRSAPGKGTTVRFSVPISLLAGG
jgi:PAS domain S-box-containing protein